MTTLAIPPGNKLPIPTDDLQLNTYPHYYAVPAILAQGLDIYLSSEHLNTPGHYRCSRVKVDPGDPNLVKLYFDNIRGRDWMVFYAQELVFTPCDAPPDALYVHLTERENDHD